MKKGLFVYLLLEIGLIVGCSKTDDTCKFQDSSVAVINELTARTVKYSSYTNVMLVRESEALPYDDFAIWLDVDPQYLTTSFSCSWPGRLLACTNVPKLEQNIKSIQILTLMDYTEEYQQGSDMTQDFLFLTEEGPISVENLATLNQYFRRDFLLFLSPQIPPDNDRFIHFKVLIEMENEDFYDITNQMVYATLN